MTRRRRDLGGLFPGIVLMLVGTAFLLERFDVLSMRQVWRLWPAIVIAIGLIHLLRPQAGRRSIFLLLIGIWLQVSTLELFGLDFGDSWPLLIMFVGASFVFDALVSTATPPKRSARTAAATSDGEPRAEIDGAGTAPADHEG